MRYVAAYLLAALGGNKNPSKDDISKILGSVGIELDGARLEKVISELNGKNVEEIIDKGSEKLASVPSGGAVGTVSPGSVPAAVSTEPAAKEEAKKEEKKAESESDDEDMGFGLFD